MRLRLMAGGIVLLNLGFLVACGGNVQNSPISSSSTGSAPVSLTMGDLPPSGVTILSFEISVTGATLNSASGNASLITDGPIEVEVEHLQVDKAFLSTAHVPAGTYDSITVTFADPKLTILNNSGGDIGNCANGSTCKLTPALSPASVTVSAAPFPLTITADQPAGLLMDFKLNASVQNDLSIMPTISFTPLAAHAGEGENEQDLEEIDDIKGQITAIDATKNTITVKDNSSGQTFTAKVDTSTVIEGFDRIGLANSFSSFQVGQIVEVNLMLLADGTFKAAKVELKVPEGANENQLEGIVIAIDSPTEFKMVVQDDALGDPGMEIGNIVTVTIQTGASFQIDTDGITLPAGVTFQSSADLLVGQNVQVITSSGGTASAVSTPQVTLHRSEITATVLSTSGVNFTVNNLNSLFTSANPPITQIDVATSPQTTFENVSGAAGLTMGDRVSLKGPLFKTTGNPLLVAEAVIKRQPED